MSAEALLEGAACPRCSLAFTGWTIGAGAAVCPVCALEFVARPFHPPVRPPVSGGLPTDQDARCAFHAGNLVSASCDRCGAFICSLCRIDADSRTLCPGCFDRLAAEGSLPSAEVTFRDYARIASFWAFIGIVVWFSAPISGPLAILNSIRAFRQKRERNEPEGTAGVVLALLLGILETALSILGLAILFTEGMK